MSYEMNPSDIFVYGKNGEMYSTIKSVMAGNGRLSEFDFQFLTAMFGVGQREFPEEKKENTYSTISRVSYGRNSIEFDIRFGLVTILRNLSDEYTDLVNNKAFVKNSNGEKYSELPNVGAFYGSLNAGVPALYEVLNVYDIRDDKSAFDALNDYLDSEYSEVEKLV